MEATTGCSRAYQRLLRVREWIEELEDQRCHDRLTRYQQAILREYREEAQEIEARLALMGQGMGAQ